MAATSPIRARLNRSANRDMAEGLKADSPMPIRARGMAKDTKPRAAPEAAVKRLQTAIAPAINFGLLDRSASMPMNSPADLLHNTQLRATGFVQDTTHPSEGPLHVLAHPTTWSATPPARQFSPAPRLGEHTRELLAQAGYDPDHIDALIAQGACYSEA